MNNSSKDALPTFICTKHKQWTLEHPQEAFEKVGHMRKVGESLIQQNQTHRAIPYFGTALETAETIFEQRLESPQLTTEITSLAVLLSNSYEQIGEVDYAAAIVQRVQKKMYQAIECGNGYETKIAFFKYCIQQLQELSRLRYGKYDETKEKRTVKAASEIITVDRLSEHMLH